MKTDAQKLIGKTILKIVNYCGSTSILFTDLETFIDLTEQDYYDYHDCSQSARILQITQDKEMWTLRNNASNSNSLT